MHDYQTKVDDLLTKYETDSKKGLSSKEVEIRQAKYGLNELQGTKKKTKWQMFLEQFKDFLVIILLIAAAISIITGILEGEGLIDGFIILAIVILNAVLGVSQEQKANNALAALKKMSSPHAKVLRDGKIKEVPSTELVVGDIVYLETGDYVSADLRLIESMNLKIDEAALTGESEPVEKDATALYEGEKILAERKNMAYMSTLITYGKGRGVVIGTAMNSEIGKIAKMLDAVVEGKTPLQKSIDAFAKVLGIICVGVSVIVFILGLIQGQEIFTLFLTAIALAVAAIPEGLTAVITVVLALGMQRMVKRNAIIKNLSTVETLGQANVICSDKTGTLTQNKMTVQKMFDGIREYTVTGNGYQTKGEILQDGNLVEFSYNVDKILKVCLLCNDAKLQEEKVIGDPTEGALLVLAAKGGLNIDTAEQDFPMLNEYPFDSNRKLMTTVNRIDEENYVLTKGAVDQLIKRCDTISLDGEIVPLDEQKKAEILKQNETYSKAAYRVLGYAYRLTDTPEAMDLENHLTFLGMTAMIDPPREEVKDAIALCHQAGIRVMMITGDHVTTAKAIAKELGILKPGHLALSGEETISMSEEEYEDAILHCDVFARSTPEDKIKIVRILQKNGNTVAMTGDGVNDAPALKQADIGVAMGITGTEVSKEASNMILTDDNFASIVSAVEEGRIIYSNIRKFTVFLVSCNIGEILIILLSMILSMFNRDIFSPEIPLLAIHLLWINLMTDSFPAFALGMEAKEADIMKEKPRSAKEPILNRATMLKVIIQGLGLAIAALASFYIGLQIGTGGTEHALTQARTMIFVTVVFGELIRTYSARSETRFIFQSNPFANKYVNLSVFISIGLVLLLVYVPFLANIFSIEALSGLELLYAIGLGFIPLLFGEFSKLLHRKLA